MRLFRFFSWSFLLLGLLLPALSLKAQSTPPFAYTSAPGDSLGRQRELNDHIARDTVGLRAAQERLAEERERLLNQFQDRQLSGTGGISNMTWQERGPSNAGGRTKAVLFDPNDPSRKKVWAASPQGGLWYTNDITDSTATWTTVSDTWASMVVSCIAADPSNPQIMYAGTGDNDQYITGGGIWKTSNGGITWTRLISTVPNGIYGSLSNSFGYVQRIVINSSGYIFAATQYGVVRSTDGGASWQFALAPTQAIGVAGTPTNNYYYDLVYSLEISTDGVLYAAFRTNKLYKATNAIGAAWREITPPGVSTDGDRTILVLAPSTSGSSQVVYAVSRGYNSTNYYQDVRWFRKSTDAGANWSTVTIPAYTSGNHFTNGSNVFSLAVDPANPDIVYAGGYGYQWFRSTTGGATWSTPLTVGNQYVYHYGLSFQPGNSANTVLVNTVGVNWTTGWGTGNASTTPKVSIRNKGYRVGNIGDVAMKPTPGTAYLLASIAGNGIVTLTKPGLGEVTNVINNSGDYSAQVFVDSDEPNIQLFSWYGSWYMVSGNSYQYLLSGNCVGGLNTAAYDSQNNILYTADGCSGAYGIRRVTGIGGTVNLTRFTTGNYVRAVKLSDDGKSLFVGMGNVIVKYTGLDQTTPTATTITASGAFPNYTYVSSIDVGASENELLVTLSSSGVAAVWYTNNGGASWVNKDASEAGLPDVQIWNGLFNPQNRKQVVVGTDLGIWTTSDITAANPGWALSNSGMPLLKINQLRYRPSDGRLVATTNGRGIFESDALAVPYASSSIAITNVSTTTLCAGNSVAVSFSTSGPAFAKAGTYEVWVSDVTGNFANQRRLGTGTSSPVSVTLPAGTLALPYGTAYRLKVVAVDAELTSSASDPLTIGNPGPVTITDRRTTPWFSTNYANICPTDQIRLNAAGGSNRGESYQWMLNGTAIAGATSQTYLAGQDGNYTVMMKQGECGAVSAGFRLFLLNEGNSILSRFGDKPQCDDSPATLIAGYAGEQATMRWARNGAFISSATSVTFVATQSGSYVAWATTPGCNLAASNPLNVTLGRSLLPKLRLPTGADSVLCNTEGSYPNTVNLTIDDIYTNQLGADAFSVVWYRNNAPITPQPNQTYLSVNQSGNYSFELRQGNCQARSNAVVVKQQAFLQPSINPYGVTKTVCPGDSRSLYSSESFPGMQWFKDGTAIPNATWSTYTVRESGTYTLRATKGACSGMSTPVSITFTNSIIPDVRSQETGSSCTNKWLDVYAYSQLSGTQFQWYKNGVAIAGATNSSLSTSQIGLYSVNVTNGACAGMSKPVYSRPYTGEKPTITGLRSACANATVRLSVSQGQGYVQWKRNGVDIPGQTSTSFFPMQSGSYSVYVISCGDFESDPVDVTIGEPTSAALTGTGLASAGQPITVPIAFTGPAPWSFTLSDGQSVQNTYLNPYPLTVTPSTTTTYSITNLLNACGTGTSSGQMQVTVGSSKADLSVSSQVSNRLVNVNDVVTYSLFVTNDGPQNADGVVLTNRLPAGVEFVDASSPGVSLADGMVRATVGTVEAGNTVGLVYRLRVTQPGTFLNAAQVAATNTPDPDSQPNSGTGDGQDDATSVDLRTANGNDVLTASANPGQVPLFSVQGNQPSIARDSVELGLTILSSDRVPQAGDVISLSLIVNNRGGATANSAVVQFELPAGWQLINNISGLDVNGQTVKAYLNPIPANSRGVRVVDVQVQRSTDPVKAQILSVTEPVVNARPGNGYQNGERDEASLQIQVRN